MQTVELKLDLNEASDLVALPNAALLKEHAADAAYLISLDEGAVENNLRLLTHDAGADLAGGWHVQPIPADAGDQAGKTDDPEASAVHGRHVYIVGSHYGKKRGPLHPSRAWFARFPIAQVRGDAPVELEIIRDKFRVHRLINDALQASGVALMARVKPYEKAFVRAARDFATAKGKKYADRLHKGDLPLNIEAASFLANGNMLLGLRCPTTDTGAPILVELAGIPAMFEDGSWPTVAGVWVLEGPGTADRMVGFRALTRSGGRTFDAVLGNLDAVDKPSLLLEHYPGGADAKSAHWRFTLPTGAGGTVAATCVEEFVDETRVEGIAPGPDGHMVYVVDEDHRVAMHFLRVE